MASVVVDASVTLAWLFRETSDTESLGTFFTDTDLLAPWIWRLEVVNAMLVRERRKLLTPLQSGRLLDLLAELDVRFAPEPEDRTLQALADAARPHQLSAYDATYLELAVRLGLPLATFDSTLRRAANVVGVSLAGVTAD